MEVIDEAVSLWVAVQSLAATWNQTLSNGTSQWNGELRCVKAIPDSVTTKQSSC